MTPSHISPASSAAPRARTLLCTALAASFALLGGPAATAQSQPGAYQTEDAFAGLTFEQPVAIASVPGETGRLFVVEKTGRIQLIADLANPSKTLFFDLTQIIDGKLETESECGLLGLAFHPDFARNGRFFISYSRRNGTELRQCIARVEVSKTDPHRADPATHQLLLAQLDPASNHNGGDLHFGPDGYLYASVGDGGAADDRFNHGRFIDKGFFAAVLRIDVDKKPGNLPPNPHPDLPLGADNAPFYLVPADNPFIGRTRWNAAPVDPAAVRTEIWATGLRNPWRFTFDPKTGRLLAGDVGQDLFEEINVVEKGGNYGWSHREGLHAFAKGPGGATPPANFQPFDPIFEYSHQVGISVTGGVFYHGSRLPGLSGAYLYADFGRGFVAALRERDGRWVSENLALEPAVSSFGVDPGNGDVLLANLASGKLRRLVAQPAQPK